MYLLYTLIEFVSKVSATHMVHIYKKCNYLDTRMHITHNASKQLSYSATHIQSVTWRTDLSQGYQWEVLLFRFDQCSATT